MGVAAALLAVAIAGGFGTLVHLTYARQTDRQLATLLRADVERVAALLASPSLGASFGDAGTRGVILQFVAADGGVVLWWGDQARLPLVDDVAPLQRDDRSYLVTVAPWAATGGTIRLAHDVSDALASRRALAGALLTSGVLVVLVAALVASVGVRRMLAPLARLARQTRALPANDPGSVAYDGPADEVGDLADGLNAALAAIRERRDRERAFLLEVAHELAAPLTLVHYHLDDLRARHADDGAYRAAAAAARELLRTSQDLLAVARGDLERALEYRIVDLRDLALRVADEYPGIAIETGEPAEVAGDPERLMQVVRNLVRNAVQASGAASGVRLSVAREGEEQVLRVADVGPGMSTEVREHAFEVGFSRSPTRRPPSTQAVSGDGAPATTPGGSGVGLSVARGLAERHGGSVRVAATSTRGTVMEVRLPALAGSDEAGRGR